MQTSLATNFPILFNALQKCNREKWSGYMHIVTDQNHKVSVGIVRGSIVSILYRIYKGQRALESLAKIKGGSFDFQETIVTTLDSPPLPDTNQILQMFGAPTEQFVPVQPQAAQAVQHVQAVQPGQLVQPGQAVQTVQVGQAVQPMQAVVQQGHAVQAVAVEPTMSDVSSLNATIRTGLQATLTKYVGPVAPLISKPVFTSARTLNEAIEMLATKIPDESQSRSFVNEAWAEFG